MAGSPNWKVYDADGKYQAACKQSMAAAFLMNLYGDGATIRWGHKKRDIAWTEGADGIGSDSYDTVIDACERKIKEIREAYRNYQR